MVKHLFFVVPDFVFGVSELADTILQGEKKRKIQGESCMAGQQHAVESIKIHEIS